MWSGLLIWTTILSWWLFRSTSPRRRARMPLPITTAPKEPTSRSAGYMLPHCRMRPRSTPIASSWGQERTRGRASSPTIALGAHSRAMSRPSVHWRSCRACVAVHAVSYRRLSRLLLELFGLAISEGALDAAFRRGKPEFDADVANILARLRRARVICSDETTVRIDGRTCWNWVFQNDEVVIHVVRKSRGAGVVAEVLGGHRPAIWVSDLYSAQQGHAADWQVCLAHQLRDCQFAIEAGDAACAARNGFDSRLGNRGVLPCRSCCGLILTRRRCAELRA